MTAALCVTSILAFEGVRARPDLVVVLGATPDGPEIDYCWIEMGDQISEYVQLFQIRRLWEKPSHELALRLWQSGCLWNSAVVVARIPMLLLLMRKVSSQLTASFESLRPAIGTEREAEAAEAIYASIPEQDLLRELSDKCPGNFAVLPVAGVEWSDLERSHRAVAALRNVRIHPRSLSDVFPRGSRK